MGKQPNEVNMANENFGFIAVNNDHGWGKGETSEAALKKSLTHGRKATHVRVWECATAESYVDGMGVVYGVKKDTKKDLKRAKPTSRVWKDAPELADK